MGETARVTDPSTSPHHPVPLLPSGEVEAGFGGAVPASAGGAKGNESAFRHGSSDSPSPSLCPHLVGLFHGILTRQSSRTWPAFGTGYLGQLFPQVETICSTYFAWPLPRIEALRNRARSRALVEKIWAKRSGAERCGEGVVVSIVSHSNGAVLALQVARELIRRGVAIRSLVLIAPALRTGPASEEILNWIARGMLDRAVLVRPTRDILIGAIGANWRTRLFSWPWGSLGHDGWDVGEVSSFQFQVSGLLTLDLPDMGHSDPVSHAHRAWLFESVICPALGLSAWGPLQPKGGIEE